MSLREEIERLKAKYAAEIRGMQDWIDALDAQLKEAKANSNRTSSWKEQITDELFKDVPQFYEDKKKGVLHIGWISTGKPCHWKAHPYCGQTLRDWIGFSEIQYSRTKKVCHLCLMVHAVIIGKPKDVVQLQSSKDQISICYLKE